MERFLIESPHTARECKMVVKLVQSMGYLNNFAWGCREGVHTGWAMIEAENTAQALGVVPALIRNQARALKLSKVPSEIVDKWGIDE